MTPLQLEPSAQAPCTRTIFGKAFFPPCANIGTLATDVATKMTATISITEREKFNLKCFITFLLLILNVISFRVPTPRDKTMRLQNPMTATVLARFTNGICKLVGQFPACQMHKSTLLLPLNSWSYLNSILEA